VAIMSILRQHRIERLLPQIYAGTSPHHQGLRAGEGRRHEHQDLSVGHGDVAGGADFRAACSAEEDALGRVGGIEFQVIAVNP